MRKVSILGSTGSIGTQALDVIRANKEKFEVTALACGRNLELLSEQIKEFAPKIAVIQSPEDAKVLAERHPEVEIFHGEEGLITAATADCDMVLNSLMGMRGLVPTYHGIQAGKDIALANKETLVAGGELVMEAVKEKGVKMLPVDSEHSAIFQCLQGNEGKEIKKILLTASGGPFRGWTREQLEGVTLAQALKHPKWTMGQKITIDSATMMNKGLEVIEAKWLFDMEPEDIDVVVHRESIVHSLIEYRDHSVIAQLGVPDMRIPIQYALTYPRRFVSPVKHLELSDWQKLTFYQPDEETFTCLGAMKRAITRGGLVPTAVNGANEIAVSMFLREEIGYLDIGEIACDVAETFPAEPVTCVEDVLAVDAAARFYVKQKFLK